MSHTRTAPPRIDRPDALPAHDGGVVMLVGTYVAFPVPLRARGPLIDMGHAGVAVGARTLRIGAAPRPAPERERLLGRRVAVTGRLVLRPTLEHPGHAVQPLPPPTIYPEGTPFPTE